MDFTRREMLGMSAAGLLLPRPLMAAPAAGGMKFLFIYCYGGWDTSLIFAPADHIVGGHTQPGCTLTEAGTLTYVDHDERPSVRSFMEQYWDRTCIINGIEVSSITHEMCSRLLLTGSRSVRSDDWPSIIAALDTSERMLPHVVLNGPAFNDQYTSRVVRIGTAGQLPGLLDGSSMDDSDLIARLPSRAVERLEEAFVKEQLEVLRDVGGRGERHQRWLQEYQRALKDGEQLQALGDSLNLAPFGTTCGVDVPTFASTALDCFEAGQSRCAMIEYNGFCNIGWDSHVVNDPTQSQHFGELFDYLLMVMEDLDGRPGEVADSLAEEVTIVLCSEMGRHPALNAWEGRDHWTVTSTVLIGPAVQGGRAVGAVSDQGKGEPVDLETADLTDGGTSLTAAHLGATLLAMADIDPSEHVESTVSPLAGVMK